MTSSSGSNPTSTERSQTPSPPPPSSSLLQSDQSSVVLDAESTPRRKCSALRCGDQLSGIEPLKSPQLPGWYPPTPLSSESGSELVYNGNGTRNWPDNSSLNSTSIDQDFLSANATPIQSLYCQSRSSYSTDDHSSHYSLPQQAQSVISFNDPDLADFSVPELLQQRLQSQPSTFKMQSGHILINSPAPITNALPSSNQSQNNVVPIDRSPDAEPTKPVLINSVGSSPQDGDQHEPYGYRRIGPALVLRSYQPQGSTNSLSDSIYPETIHPTAETVHVLPLNHKSQFLPLLEFDPSETTGAPQPSKVPSNPDGNQVNILPNHTSSNAMSQPHPTVPCHQAPVIALNECQNNPEPQNHTKGHPEASIEATDTSDLGDHTSFTRPPTSPRKLSETQADSESIHLAVAAVIDSEKEVPAAERTGAAEASQSDPSKINAFRSPSEALQCGVQTLSPDHANQHQSVNSKEKEVDLILLDIDASGLEPQSVPLLDSTPEESDPKIPIEQAQPTADTEAVLDQTNSPPDAPAQSKHAPDNPGPGSRRIIVSLSSPRPISMPPPSARAEAQDQSSTPYAYPQSKSVDLTRSTPAQTSPVAQNFNSESSLTALQLKSESVAGDDAAVGDKLEELTNTAKKHEHKETAQVDQHVTKETLLTLNSIASINEPSSAGIGQAGQPNDSSVTVPVPENDHAGNERQAIRSLHGASSKTPAASDSLTTPFPSVEASSISNGHQTSPRSHCSDQPSSRVRSVSGFFRSLSRRDVHNKAGIASELVDSTVAKAHQGNGVIPGEVKAVKKRKSLSALRRKSGLLWGRGENHDAQPPVPELPKGSLSLPVLNEKLNNQPSSVGLTAVGHKKVEEQPKVDELSNLKTPTTDGHSNTPKKTQARNDSGTALACESGKAGSTPGTWKVFPSSKRHQHQKENITTGTGPTPSGRKPGPFSSVVGGIGYSPSSPTNANTLKKKRVATPGGTGKDRTFGGFISKLLSRKKEENIKEGVTNGGVYDGITTV